ncbi:MAG: CDP-diacylglycerol--serine O-phosphatidyltransferase [Calditrichaeota bacterium]|nr:MAG: CDP-diacylglycerol--serine O-phosphatidyltransferase [Calditrichota bacterium]
MRASIVPGFFTMANMFCGYLAVLQVFRDRLTTAAWLIIAAGVLDTLDGKLARLTKSASPFGVQYDSLADVISFGFAPSVLAYVVFFQSWGNIGLFFSFLPLVFGAIRLARFNVRLKGFDKSFFEGLPIPVAAVTIASFVIFNFYFWDVLRWKKVFFLLVLLVSLLMISTIRYETMPNFKLQSDPANRIKILLVLVGGLLIVLFPHETFFPLAILYVLSGPVRVLWPVFFPQTAKDKHREQGDTPKQ